LLRGDIVDTNAAFLASDLSDLGFEVVRTVVVGDDMDAIAAALRRALEDSRVVVTTGGLGPTADDVTRDAVAAVVGEDMVPDAGLETTLRRRFASLHRSMPDNNLRQTLLIPSADPIPNENGTAPGWYVKFQDRIIITLPGPPSEMIPMWQNVAREHVSALLPGVTAMRALMTFGIGESTVEEMIRPFYAELPQVRFATYAKSTGVQVHITARSPVAAEADQLADRAAALVLDRLGDAVFGGGGDTLAGVVGALLRRRGQTVGVMESITGGAVANLLTDVSGSSEYFLGGIVAYSRAAKARYGVDERVMDDNGLISPETAESMALAARLQFRADAGLGTTGIAGGQPVEGKPPGTAFIAVAVRDRVEVRAVHRPGQRAGVKSFVAQSSLDLLRRLLESDQ